MFAMDDDHDHDPDAHGGPPFELVEKAKQATSDIDDGARKIGLYLQDSHLAVDPREPTKMVIVAQFLVGDVAFSDRVQNPVADEDLDQVKALESDLKKQEFEELRERLQQEHGGDDGAD